MPGNWKPNLRVTTSSVMTAMQAMKAQAPASAMRRNTASMASAIFSKACMRAPRLPRGSPVRGRFTSE